MEFRVIKTFQTIVRLGSFQLAAEYLKYSQPTITLHIQKLESELGFKLLERGKSIKLTEAGKIFYERANILLKEYEYLNNTLKDYSTGEAGTIRIGAAEPTASSRLPSILSLFKKRYPNTEISLLVADEKHLHQHIRNQEIDFAIGTVSESFRDIEFEALLTEKLVLLLPFNHALTKRKTIFAKDLINETLITAGQSSVQKKIEQLIFERTGQLPAKVQLGTISTLQHFVKENLGIAVVPQISATLPPDQVLVKTIHDLHEGPAIGILKHQSHTVSTAGETFLALLKQNLAFDLKKAQIELSV
ncbi:MULTISPECIES: LysR family transcriptional regulator [Priestia]|jgi:LysR family transcriptional regulator, regulator of the ytmI operon|uniref:LysR family transcriptional regulator n=1 Tax=Priestia TaxID=2800373 RepID=UPI000BF93E72|nr:MULTISPECIES: LysR family transcriptional regulator [Priestia]MBK0010051.1 LysR family transcriptional regulator [Bacillus sp. S35]MCM3255607.1 LysR family transcriptional regulator [Priestia aryabhattai]MCM3644749.1 LysR family transcriptional regulator [Priestia aryabhattai]PFW77516.1 LysR family transcriptional regulator [Priestia aryabhattai]UYP07926.1 LysR family transcriptional regulator [Priestia megaterium]